MALELVIVTPEGEVYRGPVQAAVLPGSEGDFMVLEGHERFLSPLRIGEVEIRKAAESTLYGALSGGFAEVSGTQVVVTAEACELAADIDVARAERAGERAQRELAAVERIHEESTRHRIAAAALERAIIRIQVAKRA